MMPARFRSALACLAALLVAASAASQVPTTINAENLDDECEVVVILRDGSVVEGEILGATVERR